MNTKNLTIIVILLFFVKNCYCDDCNNEVVHCHYESIPVEEIFIRFNDIDPMENNFQIMRKKIENGTFTLKDQEYIDKLLKEIEEDLNALKVEQESKAVFFYKGITFFQHQYAGARTFYFQKKFSEKKVFGYSFRESHECPHKEIRWLWDNKKIGSINIEKNAIDIILDTNIKWEKEKEIIQAIIKLSK